MSWFISKPTSAVFSDTGQTTAAATNSACRSTGHGQTPSPPPWDTSATCPNSSEPPTAPRAAQPNPTRHQPHQPHTPLSHAPKRAGPHTRTSPAATRPQPPIPQTRRWIQAQSPARTLGRASASGLTLYN